MTDAMTSDVKPGPPRVIAQIRSNDRRPPISDRMITVTVAGHASGSVMWRNSPSGVAPSTLAAS